MVFLCFFSTPHVTTIADIHCQATMIGRVGSMVDPRHFHASRVHQNIPHLDQCDCWHQTGAYSRPAGSVPQVFCKRSMNHTENSWHDLKHCRFLHPRKLRCPLKREYFNRIYIFQPLIFRGHSFVFGSVNHWISRVCSPKTLAIFVQQREQYPFVSTSTKV